MYKFRYTLIAFAILVITLAQAVGSTATLSEDANTVIFQIYNAETDYPIWTESHHDIGEFGTENIKPGLIIPIPDLDEGDYYLEIIVDGERYGDLIAFSGREELRRIMSSGSDTYDTPSEPGDIMDAMSFTLRLGGPEPTDITHLRGMLGIGTETPTAQLHTTGSVRFAGAGTIGDGRVLTSDAAGNATWQVLDADNYEGWRLRLGTYDPYLVRSYDQVEFVGAGGIDVEYEYIGDIHTVTIDGIAMGGGNWAYSEEPGHEDDIHNLNTGFVGIGTTEPTQALDIDGRIRIRGGDPAEGRVLTSDALGNATWLDPECCNYEINLGGTTWDGWKVSIRYGGDVVFGPYDAGDCSGSPCGSFETCHGDILEIEWSHPDPSPPAGTPTEAWLRMTVGTKEYEIIASGGRTGATTHTVSCGAYLLLYKENPAYPTEPTATGRNAVAIGSGSVASGQNAIVGGGLDNTASGHQSTVSGGQDNEASASGSVIGGGRGNIAGGNYSTVVGGLNNRIYGVGGTDYGSTILGGQNNSIAAGNSYSMVFGTGVHIDQGFRTQFYRSGMPGRVGINVQNDIDLTAALTVAGNARYEHIDDMGTDDTDFAHKKYVDDLVDGLAGSKWAYSEEPGHEDDIHNLNTGNVGIGITEPTQALDIDGRIRIRGGDPAEGRVLTSDADGVATWEEASHTLETLTRGMGLTGDDYDGSSPATWSVDFAGSGSATTVARSDHYHEVFIDPCGASVYDVDGNSYETVRIGDQCWFLENLRTTKYRDGTSIPHVMDGGTWGALVSGAYCEYDNDPSHVSTYGRIYNWYAVDDARGLCPTGWRVADHDDWAEIRITLGMSEGIASSWGWHGTDQGSQLGGEYDLWNAGDLRDDPTFGSSGFNAIPGGLRQSFSPWNFAGLGNGAWIWHATENSETNSWYTTVYFDRTTVGNHTNPKRAGKYVRCIMEGYDGGVSASEFIRNQNAEDQAADFRISGDGIIGGNVGIGTTTPEAKLDVHGDINLNQNQAKGLVIENRTEPPATPVPGQIWFIVE